jgi:uncharacterized membrane protein YfcA
VAEHRTLWQAAWGIIATIAAGFVVGLLIARITSEPPLLAIIAAGVVMFVALYFVFAPVWHWPPCRRGSGDPLDHGDGTTVTSYDQSGGITAGSVTIDSDAQKKRESNGR